jgi:glycerol-3-phosphate acyltransferase PlsY
VYVVAAFLAGSIPFGVLIARRYGVNIQERGSGNIGATNVARVLGKAPALITLVLDGAKAAAPTYLARRGVLLDAGAAGLGAPLDLPGLAGPLGTGHDALVVAVGFAAMLGHCFSPWLRFRGGKGVACAVGVYLVISPLHAAIAVGVFLAVLLATRVPALGSIAGMIAMAVALTWRSSPIYGGFAIATALLIVFTHRSNLRKLVGKQPQQP